MPVEAQIPSISKGIAVEVIRNYLLHPNEAFRETAKRMEDENPHLLGHSIISALGIMQAAGERASLLSLKSGFYYYQCYSQEAADQGIPIISVRRATVNDIFENNMRILDSFSQTQDETVRQQYLKDADDQVKGFTKALENNNPHLLSCTRGFYIEEEARGTGIVFSLQHFLKGGMFIIHNALNQQLNISSQDKSNEKEDTDQALGHSFFPAASGKSIRESLVEIILDRKEFTQTSLEYLTQFCPDWANALDKAEYTTLFTRTEYELFVSLVVGVYAREFSRRNLLFPPVSLNRIRDTLGIVIEDGIVLEAPEPKFRIQQAYDTLEAMGKENLSLYRAYFTLVLGRGLGSDFNNLSQAAIFAATDAYSLIKAQAEAEYWERMLKQ